MSQENVETVQRAVDAWNADDLDAFLAELDADVEWHPAIEPGLEGKATTYRGHDGARKIWRQDRGEAWERLTNRPQEFRDLGESVLVLGHIDLTARATGIEFTQEVGEVFDLRAGRIVRIRDFLTHAEALEAVRLSESAMSQENVEIVRRMFDAFTNLGDLRTSAEFLDEGIVFDTRGMEWDDEDFVRVYFGPEGVRDFWRAWLPAWSDMRVDVQWIRGVGDRVLVWLHQRQVGRVSRLPVEFFLAWDIQFRDGKIVRVAFFRDERKALEAAGLSE